MTSLNPDADHRLPAESDTFVGRERDVTDLCRLLPELRTVTLCGAGGIGKTRLAVRVARAMLDTLPGRVWFVDLSDLREEPGAGPAGPADPITRRVATVLGVGDEGRDPAETLADALGSRPALLVLDNCEHLTPGCAALAETLLRACPGLSVLATSREPLRVSGETVWRVPPLEPADAVRLFVDRARAVRPDFTETGAVGDVSRALDGVPLALELAAARVRVLSVEQIAERLGDRFRLLSAADRSAPPRQRTLRAAIDWSHELLGPAERVLLRRLSVFAGWTLQQAELVCVDEDPGGDLPPEALLDLLTALVDKSLVSVGDDIAGETRFRLLDSIRQYAAERLDAAGETEATRTRHRDAILEAAELNGEVGMAEIPAPWADRIAVFRLYDAELGNVRAALGWSLERGDLEEGLRICTALRGYWIVRGQSAEWATWIDRFLERMADGGQELPAFVLGPALASRAQLASAHRDFATAVRHAEAALEPCRKAGDDFMAAGALITLAEAAIPAGRFDEADAYLDEADLLSVGPEQGWTRGYALNARGHLRLREGRLREAGELLEAALRTMHDIDHQWGVARALVGLGRLAALRGDLAAARNRYDTALPILAEVGARPEMARALAGNGRIALDLGDVAEARRALTESLELSRAMGVRLDAARTLEAFAELLACEGDLRGAVLLAGASAGLRDAVFGGEAPSPGTGARIERILEPIRRKLGEPLVAQLWGQGRVTSADDAIAYALRAPAPAEEDPAAPEPDLAMPLAAPVSAPLDLTASRAVPVTPPSTLTAREREIAALVARGLSNRGIAEELVISPATVARHVTNILTKLGFASRAQVAAWAVDHINDEPAS